MTVFYLKNHIILSRDGVHIVSCLARHDFVETVCTMIL